ncbi:SDR family NAD(P)-dependent oxidoreductase [Granulicoccus sp. GXG6511]|uniref:SDR family NAD(P)-dependent oxidoreductase n=1 Tax=Granulicoccus sp. GXG6511 TaxID=3381351 RepID=UPI003D7D6FD0
MFDLSGQVAVVTGASSGLGLQMSHGLAEHGAELVMLARRMDRLEAAAAEVAEQWGVRTHAVTCDVTDLAQIQDAVKKAKELCGRIDILVNNAGAGAVTPALDMTDEQWNWDLAVDLSGVFRMSREFGREMVAGNYGRIINIASMYGMVGNTTAPAPAYHAAKGGVINLTRALAAEWAPNGVTVNCLCPGYFETELTAPILESDSFQEHMGRTVPLQRHGQSGELNSACVFLAAKESTYITGQVVTVDGGYTAV